MRRRAFIAGLGGAVVGRAQQIDRTRRVGTLLAYQEGDELAQARIAAFRRGLQRLGWVEGRNIQIEYRVTGRGHVQRPRHPAGLHRGRELVPQGSRSRLCFRSGYGRMYLDGRGVPQNYVLAHMWLNLAASKGNKEAFDYRNKTAEKMTPAQIGEAQKLARECAPSATTPTEAPHQ